MKARVLIDRTQVIRDGKYAVSIKVFEVEASKKYPAGIKAKFVLQDIENGFARLLVDNHEPFGFHIHTRLPRDRNHRELLDVRDHQEALAFFLDEVERVVKNYET
ncbi:MAG: hypothetical protein NDJ90_11020 [Oligoflexia bacterium]|nr:hypothetical protein [Oligoflexia bacterium]